MHLLTSPTTPQATSLMHRR